MKLELQDQNVSSNSSYELSTHTKYVWTHTVQFILGVPKIVHNKKKFMNVIEPMDIINLQNTTH